MEKQREEGAFNDFTENVADNQIRQVVPKTIELLLTLTAKVTAKAFCDELGAGQYNGGRKSSYDKLSNDLSTDIVEAVRWMSEKEEKRQSVLASETYQTDDFKRAIFQIKKEMGKKMSFWQMVPIANRFKELLPEQPTTTVSLCNRSMEMGIAPPKVTNCSPWWDACNFSFISAEARVQLIRFRDNEKSAEKTVNAATQNRIALAIRQGLSKEVDDFISNTLNMDNIITATIRLGAIEFFKPLIDKTKTLSTNKVAIQNRKNQAKCRAKKKADRS